MLHIYYTTTFFTVYYLLIKIDGGEIERICEEPGVRLTVGTAAEPPSRAAGRRTGPTNRRPRICRNTSVLPHISMQKRRTGLQAVALGDGAVAAPGPAAVDQSVAGPHHGLLAVMTLPRGKR